MLGACIRWLNWLSWMRLHSNRATGSPAAARGLWAASHGLDSREITTVREEKSIGSEETLAEDTRDMRVVCGLLRSACDEVTSTLRRKGLVARTLTVKLRFADLSYQTRSFTMERPTDTAGVLYPECVRQLKVMLGLPASAESATPLPKTIRLAGMARLRSVRRRLRPCSLHWMTCSKRPTMPAARPHRRVCMMPRPHWTLCAANSATRPPSLGRERLQRHLRSHYAVRRSQAERMASSVAVAEKRR